MAIAINHLLPLFFILFSVFSFWPATSESTRAIIDYLPGFDGPLPFKLETGYTEVGEDNDAQLFYYFIESQGNPKTDPIVLWLAGGPRCSTFTGLIYEIGPIAFKDGYRETHMEGGGVGGIRQVVSDGDVPGLQLNPYAWTQIASIIFVDQPVGSGFSYSKAGREGEMTDTKSALDTYKFLLKWLKDHPQYLSNPLYVSGDSYSGITVPQVVQHIIRGIEEHEAVINFHGYTIGNPVTDREFETNSEVPFSHRMGLISDELYESLNENCKGNYVNFDSSNHLCAIDYKRFSKIISGVNPYCILEPLCSAASKQNDSSSTRHSLENIRLRASNCRDDGYKLSEIWANDDRVQTALRVRKGTITIKEWVRCNSYGNPDQIDHGVKYVMDVKSSLAYHRNISTKGYRALIYSGDHDMRISHVSTEAWIRSLNISVVDEWHPWFVEGQVAGFTTRYANGMIYATLKGAGHITPEYLPKESYALFKKWLLDNAL